MRISSDTPFLEQAQFLTSFQSFYAVDDDNLFDAITPSDVQAVYSYRSKLQRHQDLEEEAFLFDFHNNKRPEGSENPFQKDVEESRKEIEETEKDERLLRLDALIERFEVWSTKDIASHLLLSHDHDRETENDAVCWSMLMNIPSASYASTVLPPVKNRGGEEDEARKKDFAFNKLWNKKVNEFQTHPCSLLLPPNIHTWPEYLRIAHMVSMLPNEQARALAHNSPLAGDEKSHRETTQIKFHLNPADLVALWVRAQRNTQAMRHLINLFTVQKEEDDAETSSNDEASTQRPRPRYRATYRGNHRLMLKRVVHESPLVDRLTEWAVVNQICMTQPRLMEAWRNLSIAVRKRRVNSTGSPGRGGAAAKKMRMTNQDDTLDEFIKIELRRACRCFLLRTFSRRNRRAVSVLFYRDEEEMELVKKSGIVVDSWTEKLVKARLMERIKEHPKYKESSTDRKLPRIDRRVVFGRYDDDDTLQDNGADFFYYKIRTLLECLRDCAKNLGFDHPMFQETIDNWDLLYRQTFLKELKDNGLLSAARLLHDLSNETIKPTALAQALRQTPAPWVVRCSVCDASLLKDESTSFRVCACCDQAIHVSCDDKEDATLRSKSFVKGYEALKKMYTIQVPKNSMPPDFRGKRAKEVKWEMKAITIERSVGENGMLPPYGLALKQSEDCAETLDRILSGSCLVSDFDNLSEFAVAYEGSDHQGAIVAKAYEGQLGEESGLRIGDLIIAFEPLEFLNPTVEESKYRASIMKRFSQLSKTERLGFFRLNATKIRMVVARPAPNIVHEILEWRRRIIECNEPLLKSLGMNEAFWYCEKCRNVEKKHRPELQDARICREARFCKAVIQSIEMESSGLAFLNEDHVSSQSISECESGDLGNEAIAALHASSVSLRRLDSMMDFIIQQHSPDDVLRRGGEDLSLEAAFLVGSRRLHWAPKEIESDPFELLCCGMSLIACSQLQSKGAETRNAPSAEERTALLTHFLRVFCSWCLGVTLTSQSFSISGPPPYALSTRFPLLQRCCPQCLVRSLPNESLYGSCDCCAALSKVPETYTRIDPVMKSYESRASLVGTTILVLPGDPLLNSTMEALEKVNVKIEHLERPVELLVASYLPAAIAEEDDPRQPNLDGVFHLLPVVSQHQLQFLLARCKLRQASIVEGAADHVMSDDTIREWKNDGLLDLQGVVKLSYDELTKRLEERAAIIKTISSEVAKQAQCTCRSSLRLMNSTQGSKIERTSPFMPCRDPECASKESLLSPCFDTECFTSTEDVEMRGSILVQSMVHSRTPVFLEMESPNNTDGLHLGLEVDPTYGGIDAEAHCGPLVQFDDAMARNIARHDDLTINFPRQPVGRSCRVLYSDLYAEEHDHGTDRYLPQYITSPAAETQIVLNSKSVVLVRKHDDEDFWASEEAPMYRGVGWGLELVCWENDNDYIRIGRVHGNSPALRAGLCSGDVVVSANGKILKSAENPGMLTRALLSLPVDSSRSPAGAINSAARILGPGKRAVGPVILEIRKAASIPDHFSLRGRLLRKPDTDEGSKRRVSSLRDRPLQKTDALQWSFETQQSEDRRMESERRLGTQMHSVGDFRLPGAHRSNMAAPGLRPPYRASQAAAPLRVLASRPFGRHRFVDASDLYAPSFPGSALSRVETSVLLECVHRNQTMLGFRLLSPRYGVGLLFNQLELLSHLDVSSIPRIPEYLYAKLVRADYKRSLTEDRTADIQFDDGDYSYRMPTSRLPIDRVVEELLSPERSHPAPQLYDLTHEDGDQWAGGVDPTARLRGGGGESLDSKRNGRLLSDAEKTSWHGTLVYGYCQTTLEESAHGEAKFIGYVVCPDSTIATERSETEDDTESEEAIPVTVFFLSNVGVMSEELTMNVDPDDLYIAEPGSEEENAASDWQKLNLKSRQPGADSAKKADVCGMDSEVSSSTQLETNQEELPTGNQGSSFTEKTALSSRARTPSDGSPKDANAQNMAAESKAFIDRLCTEQKTALSPIGTLPDGRSVFWLHGDPRALYISASIPACPDKLLNDLYRVQSSYRSDIRKNFGPQSASSPDGFFCLWGCGTVLGDGNTRKCLEFPSLIELLEHVEAAHSFSPTKSSVEGSADDDVSLERIAEGEGVCLFLSSITAAACARSPSFIPLTREVNPGPGKGVASGQEFHTSPTGTAMCFDESSFLEGKTLAAVQSSSCSQDAIDLVSLTWRVMRLFDADGRFRLSWNETTSEGSVCRSKSQSRHSNETDCVVCDLGTERVLLRDTDDESSRTSSLYRGVGCSPLSSLCFHIDSVASSVPGNVNSAKVFLLRLAERIPLPVRVGPRKDLSEAPGGQLVIHERFWEDKNFELWRRFVLGSQTIRSLTQAFLVLLASVDRKLLPAWWRSEGSGWSTAQGLVQNTSRSALLLHMLIFDCALAEFASLSCSKKPPSFNAGDEMDTKESIDHEENVKRTLEWAKSLGLESWEGEYNSYCTVCEDGGDLLCCELCPNVYHATCCKPPFRGGDFLCNSCMADISILKKLSDQSTRVHQ